MIVNSTRKSITHLEKAKPVEFLSLAREILQMKHAKISLKVDGAGIRFGKDEVGNFFFETSRSGPIQTKNAFSEHAKSREGCDLARAKHYDDLYDALEASSLWLDLPNDTKVSAEVLFNPMAEEIRDSLRFVSVAYEKTKLGSIMTIIPFGVVVASNGIVHKEHNEILEMLLRKSNSKIKIETPDLGKVVLDVETILQPLLVLGPDLDAVIASRKAVDKPKKELYNMVIQSVKDQLAQFILSNPKIKGKDKFGPEIEGLVLDMGSRQFKVTTPEFKASKKET